MKTRLNGEEGYAEIKDGGVMIFNQFTLIACWLLAQLYNCKLFVVCCLYSLSLFILSQRVLQVDRQTCKNHALGLVLCTFTNNKSNRFSRYLINAVALFSTGLTVDL